MFGRILSFFLASSLCTDSITPSNWDHPGEFPKQETPCPIQQNLSTWHDQLYLSGSDKVSIRESIYQATRQGVYPPISTLDPRQMPNQNTGHPVQPGSSVWRNKDGKTPSCDFAENIGLHPGAELYVLAGPYSVVPKDGGINFSIPTALPIQNKGVDNTQVVSNNTNVNNSPRAILGVTVKTSELPSDYTISYDTGNLVRNVKFGDDHRSLVIKIAQGPAYQSAQFLNATPELLFQTSIQVDQSTIHSPTGEDAVKYKVVANGQTYLIYGTNALQLHIDESQGVLTGALPYTGFIQLAICPDEAEPLLDAHAGVVVIQGEGAVNYPGYEYNYLCVDLEGKPTPADPIILLKYHAQETFCQNAQSFPEKMDLTYYALSGPYRGVVGANLQFSEAHNLPSSPKLFPNDVKFSDEQVDKLKALYDHMTFPAFSSAVYEGGKILQNVATAIEAGVALVFDVSGHVEDLKKGLATYFKQLAFDTNYHSIVDIKNAYGNGTYLNDHIVQFTYAIHAAATVVQYERDQKVSMPWLMDASGIGNYTNKDIVDIICRDVNNPSYQDPIFVKSRYTDIYEGHSWLSGLNGYPAGNNMESSSEALNGQLSLYRWGNATDNQDLEKYGAVMAAFEARGSRDYYQIADPAHSLYPKNYANDQLVATNVYQNMVDCTTFWGTSWDRKIGIEFLPPNPIMVQMLLEDPLNPGKPSVYAQRVMSEIKKKWDWNQLDSNAIQADLVNMVSIVDPDYADELIQGLIQHNYFDIGANDFVLSATNEYFRARGK